MYEFSSLQENLLKEILVPIIKVSTFQEKNNEFEMTRHFQRSFSAAEFAALLQITDILRFFDNE